MLPLQHIVGFGVGEGVGLGVGLGLGVGVGMGVGVGVGKGVGVGVGVEVGVDIGVGVGVKVGVGVGVKVGVGLGVGVKVGVGAGVKVGVGLGETGLRAEKASTTPQPYFSSQPTGPLSLAEFSKAARTPFGSDIPVEITKAAAPETWGAAIEVPWKK